MVNSISKNRSGSMGKELIAMKLARLSKFGVMGVNMNKTTSNNVSKSELLIEAQDFAYRQKTESKNKGE